MTHTKTWACVKPGGAGCDGNHTPTHAERIEAIKKRVEAATKGPWKLDHNDTHVMAEKDPPEHDWYWITGSMEVNDGYSYAEDEDMRGPKEIVQANCRFIAHSREDIPYLLSRLEAAESVIEAAKRITHRDEGLHRVIVEYEGGRENG